VSDYFDDNKDSPAEASTDNVVGGKAEIVNLAGRRWLVGMTWHTYEEVLPRSALAEEADIQQADWIARRAGNEVVQVGYCEAPTAAWPNKLFSLAALLADSHKVPWAGAFDLGDGRWWYIAVRDNYTIMPDGDVVGSYEDILRARQEHASIEDFNHVDGDRSNLEDLIQRSRGRRTAIEAVRGSQWSPLQKHAIAMGTCALLIAGVGYAYWRHVQTQRADEQRIANARKQIQSAIGTQPLAAPNLEADLRNAPDPVVWLDACQAAINSRPPWERGWQLTAKRCQGGQLTVRWIRRGIATIAYMPAGVMDKDGNGDTETIALRFAVPQGTIAALPITEARNRMILWGQLHDIKINFEGNPDAPAAQNTDALSKLPGQAPPPPPVKQYSIDFTVPAAPFALDFTGLVGLRINDVELMTGQSGVANPDPTPQQVVAGSWHIAGVLYGR